MAKKKLSASEYARAESIFKNKGWEIKSEKQEISQYNNFLSRISILPKETKSLFFELTERFENISLNEIITIFKESYKQIDPNLIDMSRKIYFLPLICPIIKFENDYKIKFLNKFLNFFGFNNKKEIERPTHKSCDFILSLIKIEYRDMYGNGKFLFPSSYFKFKEQYDKNKDLVILVDDFVGTGDTAEEVLDFYLKEGNLNPSKTKIITLVSQEEGVKRIYEKSQVEIFANVIKNKALSDVYLENRELEEKKNLIVQMSKSINIKQDFLGYKDSEALVCILNKSPNNTLPIFWHESKTYPAPFPRRKVFHNK
jgi:hypoxanthine phosphoribosyltransferase